MKNSGTPRATTFRSETEAAVALEAQDVANAGSIAVVLVNPNGDASTPASLTVT